MHNTPAHTPKAQVGQPFGNSISQDSNSVNKKFSDRDPDASHTNRSLLLNALKKFSGGIVVDGITKKVNKRSREEYTRSKSTERLYRRHSDKFADKMRTAEVASDIVIAASDWNRDGGLKHPRDDNFVDFDHGKTLIMSG